MYENIIVPEIIAGMKAAHSNAIQFTENFAPILNTEYLITVNIAQKISKLGPIGEGNPTKVYLEEPTKTFSSKCVPLMKSVIIKNYFNNNVVFRKPKNTDRNGRIDISVYEDALSGLEDKPVCAIEVKGVGPSKKLVIKDLNRNLEYFKLFCKTGPSIIEFTAFSAMYSYPKSINSSEEKTNNDIVKDKYEKYLNSIALPSNVEAEIKEFTVSKFLREPGYQSPEFEYEDDSHELHHLVGVIVIFRWESN